MKGSSGDTGSLAGKLKLIVDGLNNLSAKGDYSRLAHIALKNCNV